MLCPLCLDISVAALSSPQYKVGDTITMKLMVREKVRSSSSFSCKLRDLLTLMLSYITQCNNSPNDNSPTLKVKC